MKKNHPTITLVIPSLNEEKGIEHVLRHVPKIVTEIIVVDGLSTDKTVEIARSLGAKVILEPVRGYGLALRRGFDLAKGEVIVTIDADGTYPIEEIPALLEYFQANKTDFLVSCRFPLLHKHVMPLSNFFGNLIMSAFTSLLNKAYVTDACSGMWMMKKDVWHAIRDKVKDNRWFFSNEIKIEILKHKQFNYDEKWIALKKRLGNTKVGNVWFIGLYILIKIIVKSIL